jgi:hypothetical protein
MTLPSICPGCKAQLKETAKGHCQDQRKTPCGWVRCKGCMTIVDAKGRFHDPKTIPQ